MKFSDITINKISYIILSIFSLGILFKTYKYLDDLKNCQCYNDSLAYSNLSLDIEFLKAYQIFEMFLVSIFLVLIFLCKKSSKTKKDTFSLTFLTTATILLISFVTGYITYNVFVLYSLSKEKCKCIDKWQKYFIYLQGIMNSITFLRIVFLLFIVFLLLLLTSYKATKNILQN
tara:strand:- start:6511 stop:7032 length:522 start_codon:yes stop_codon:yes gene_type:complete